MYLMERGISMDNSKDKTCKNCEFYLKHYFRSTQGYRETLGHCLNAKLRPVYFKKAFSLQHDCEYFKPAEDNKLQEKLENNLQRLAKELEAVCEVLLDEELIKLKETPTNSDEFVPENDAFWE